MHRDYVYHWNICTKTQKSSRTFMELIYYIFMLSTIFPHEQLGHNYAHSWGNIYLPAGGRQSAVPSVRTLCSMKYRARGLFGEYWCDKNIVLKWLLAALLPACALGGFSQPEKVININSSQLSGKVFARLFLDFFFAFGVWTFKVIPT